MSLQIQHSFLHRREYLEQGDIVIVDCSHQCNITLMSDLNFSKFKAGKSHNYYGGFYQYLPARIVAPCEGYWNIVLDLGGRSATVRHSISIIRN